MFLGQMPELFLSFQIFMITVESLFTGRRESKQSEL
jgi:hypothetical protein